MFFRWPGAVHLLWCHHDAQASNPDASEPLEPVNVTRNNTAALLCPDKFPLLKHDKKKPQSRAGSWIGNDQNRATRLSAHKVQAGSHVRKEVGTEA